MKNIFIVYFTLCLNRQNIINRIYLFLTELRFIKICKNSTNSVKSLQNPKHKGDWPLASDRQCSVATLKMTPFWRCYMLHGPNISEWLPSDMPCHSWSDFNFRSDYWFTPRTVLYSAPVLITDPFGRSYPGTLFCQRVATFDVSALVSLEYEYQSIFGTKYRSFFSSLSLPAFQLLSRPPRP